MTSSRSRKPPEEEWFSARNLKFMDKKSTGGMEFCRSPQLKDADSGRQDQNARKSI
jgi:hypothetical protein